MNLNLHFLTLGLSILLASCAAYGPYHPNTSAEPLNSVRGPKDGRYKLAFVEFGDQGSALDTSQRAAALGVIQEKRHAYVGRSPGAKQGTAVAENRPLLIILQSENDHATGTYFPIGTGLFNVVNLRFHWDQVPIPGNSGQQLSEGEFYTQTPGNNKYLVNYHVVPMGGTTPPPGLKAADNRAFEANIRQNLQDNIFDTSERNDGHEDRFCHDANYNPSVIRPPTGRELWRRWQFVYTGNARVPCWIVRVPKDIIWGHMGIWSDNSIAMLGALYRLHFPLTSEGKVAPSEPIRVPKEPDVQQLNQDKPR